MIYKEVSKVHKGVIRTLWLIAALSLVLSYAVMCIAWLSKGCRYGAQFCINVFMRALPLCLIFLCIVELAGLFIWVFKIKKLERLYAKKGGCDEYFELLEKYLLRQNKDKGHGLLKLAAVYISEKRFENCFLTLDRIAFDKLTPSDQNKYFELLLYGRLMSGDISQANEIFVSAEHYFKRGLLDKRNGQMLFTIGLLEYFNERFEAAVKFFDSAEKIRDADKALRCNCELYKGECFLAQGDVRSAKASAEKSAVLVSDDKQEAQLGKLMTQVEKAYIRTKEKSADTKADNTTEGGYAF